MKKSRDDEAWEIFLALVPRRTELYKIRELAEQAYRLAEGFAVVRAEQQAERAREVLPPSLPTPGDERE